MDDRWLLIRCADAVARQRVCDQNTHQTCELWHRRAQGQIACGFARVTVHDWFDRERLSADACVLVNTTTLGMANQPPLEIDLSGLATDAVVYDIVYAPLDIPRAQLERVVQVTAERITQISGGQETARVVS